MMRIDGHHSRRPGDTHALANQREGRSQGIYLYATFKVADTAAIFPSMRSVSTLEFNRELGGARLALDRSRCQE